MHLSAISRILEKTQPPDLGQTEELSLPHTLASGPFAGLEVPHASPSANAAHVHRTLIDTYLITHPHLDHISGFVINTAGLPGSRPKRLAGLPSTIAAFKTHIFNNVIWPNLSDENNGAGLVTYMRLVEGGSPAFGDGDDKGYLEVSDGLAVKTWGVSHGHCIERHSHRGSGSSTRFGSVDAGAAGGPLGVGLGASMALASPRGMAHHNSPNLSAFIHQQQQQQQQQRDPFNSSQQGGVLPGSVAASGGGRRSSASAGGLGASGLPTGESVCVYDSSAYFIRDMATGREVLMFGDVEPDSISLSPRNGQIWQEAAPKIATGNLVAIFIECSYDDSQDVDRLFGHLAPRFVMEEMAALADEVGAARRALRQRQDGSRAGSATPSIGGADKKKRKRDGADDGSLARRAATRAASGSAAAAAAAAGGGRGTPTQAAMDDPVSPRTVKPVGGSLAQPRPDEHTAAGTSSPHITTPTAALTLIDVELPPPVTPLNVVVHQQLQSQQTQQRAPPEPLPLKGLRVVIIHMKDKLNDGPHIGDIILGELQEYEKEAQLGCEFVISSEGQALYF